MSDSRRFAWYRQRKKRGFDDRDTWSLDHTIVEFVLPRLKRFREIEANHPSCITMEKWNSILDKMIYAMEAIQDEWNGKIDFGSDKKIQQGLNLFGKYFRHLWW